MIVLDMTKAFIVNHLTNSYYTICNNQPNNRIKMIKNSFINQIYNKLHRLIWPGLYKIQSFTFFIPSPPSRKTGYREREFDVIFYNFINQGYDILDVKTQTSSNRSQSGMWIIFTVKAKSVAASKLNLDNDFLSQYEIDTAEAVEGLYQIENDEENNNIEY